MLLRSGAVVAVVIIIGVGIAVSGVFDSSRVNHDDMASEPPVVGCAARAEPSVERFDRRRDVIRGAFALVTVERDMPRLSRASYRPRAGWLAGAKLPVGVRAGHKAELRVSAAGRDHAALLYREATRDANRIDDGDVAVVFEPCRADAPAFSGGTVGSITGWAVALIVTGPQCVRLEVWVDGTRRPDILLPLGRRCETSRSHGPAEPPALPTAAPLGIVGEAASNEVTRLDPVSLVPRGPRAELGEFHGAWSFSPDGSQIAFGISASGRSGRTAVRVIDRDSLTVTGEIEAGAAAQALGWVAPQRIAALTIPYSTYDGFPGRPGTRRRTFPGELLLADASTGRVLTRRPVSVPQACTPPSVVTAAGSAVLVSGRKGNPPRLALLGADGRYRNVTLSRLPAKVRDGACGDLAVDSARNRVYVVAAGAPVAEVDLRTLAVRYDNVRIAPPSSRCQRTAVRCVPRRRVLWLGARRLAVFGEDAIGRTVRASAGVRLVDLAAGTTRTLDRRASDARLSGPTLLTFGNGSALHGFGLQGARRFTAHRVSDVQLAGGYAYARLPASIHVLDPTSGETIARASPPRGRIELLEHSHSAVP